MSIEKPKTYRIRLSTRAAKYLSRLNKSTATRILDRIEILKEDPHGSSGVKKLAGKMAGLYRLRIGNYRAVYDIDEKGYIVIVLLVGPRGDIYKR